MARQDHNREYSAETVKMALDFVFDYGPCDIHINNQQEGKTGQWFYTWRTYNNTKEIAVILEDYLTVSPYFFSWLKLVHSLYGERSDVSGFALQGKQIRHSDSVCCLNISIQHKVFLYSMFGVSGFSPNNKQWLQYIAWSPEHTLKMRGLPVKKSRHVTAGQKYDQLRWAMEYIQYTRTNKQFTLYSNFKGNKGLAYNWNDGESDSDFKGEGNGTDTDGLLLEWTTDYENLPAIPVYVNTTGVIIKTQVPMK
ncbi:uncharacterized protein LOC132716740 [Ruditapes philippinarum]|uniref:uncharacterized protein LOC132716740 n=1 Tax=Ruditapes philippinarum TaxID=129788 RepID=UPI00295ACC7E|nr:uncharacterized protein LOC132716740 [Ruditapes philippinarum]